MQHRLFVYHTVTTYYKKFLFFLRTQWAKSRSISVATTSLRRFANQTHRLSWKRRFVSNQDHWALSDFNPWRSWQRIVEGCLITKLGRDDSWSTSVQVNDESRYVGSLEFSHVKGSENRCENGASLLHGCNPNFSRWRKRVEHVKILLTQGSPLISSTPMFEFRTFLSKMGAIRQASATAVGQVFRKSEESLNRQSYLCSKSCHFDLSISVSLFHLTMGLPGTIGCRQWLLSKSCRYYSILSSEPEAACIFFDAWCMLRFLIDIVYRWR